MRLALKPVQQPSAWLLWAIASTLNWLLNWFVILGLALAIGETGRAGQVLNWQEEVVSTTLAFAIISIITCGLQMLTLRRYYRAAWHSSIVWLLVSALTWTSFWLGFSLFVWPSKGLFVLFILIFLAGTFLWLALRLTLPEAHCPSFHVWVLVHAAIALAAVAILIFGIRMFELGSFAVLGLWYGIGTGYLLDQQALDPRTNNDV
ncbi:MAG: hypothetical protein MUD01_28130 [Chloroflexaceae bacterium]|jgi:hypothetical protein|nr:hypothetical protein [Chloroflexaceae bacterium]